MGEASSIALACEKEVSILLIDETKGRLMAKQYGLTISGTVGVIVLAKQMNIVSFIKPYLYNLKANGFWLSDSFLAEILKKANES